MKTTTNSTITKSSTKTKRTNRNSIVWLCGAGAVILAGFMLFLLLNKGSNAAQSDKAPEQTIASNEKQPEIQLLIGAYGNYFYTYSFNQQTLEFKRIARAQTANPSYVIKDNDAIYAVKETAETSALTYFNEDLQPASVPTTTGLGPCFIMADDAYIYTADYDGGSMTIIPKDGGEAQIMYFSGTGPVAGRQESSHIHQIRQLPGDNSYILASDLGADKIRLIRKGTGSKVAFRHIADIACPAGTGPRHMEFSQDGNYLYCIGELSGNVLVYSIDRDQSPAAFTLIQEVQADEVNAGGSADIHMHPNGKFLYSSHRLDNDGISIFSIGPDGKISKTGYARTARRPRNFMICPDGNLLLVACRDDKLIQVFRIGEDGQLSLTPSVLQFENEGPSSITL